MPGAAPDIRGTQLNGTRTALQRTGASACPYCHNEKSLHDLAMHDAGFLLTISITISVLKKRNIYIHFIG